MIVGLLGIGIFLLLINLWYYENRYNKSTSEDCISRAYIQLLFIRKYPNV